MFVFDCWLSIGKLPTAVMQPCHALWTVCPLRPCSSDAPALCRSMEMELAALQAQLEREQAAAAGRQAEQASTLASLDASRQQVGCHTARWG